MNHSIIKATLVLSLTNILLRSLGFLREVLLASTYGASAITDAFVIAFSIPSIMLAFIATSVSTMYIPLYQSNKDRKDLFTSNILNIFLVIGLAFSLVFAVFPKPLVSLFASQLDAETFELATMLLRIMVWTAVPILLAEILKSYMHMHGAFFRSSISTAAISICMIVAIPASQSAHAPHLLGIGAVIGYTICMVMLFLSARNLGLVYHPYLNVCDKDITELLYLVAPVTLVMAVDEINNIINRNIASSLPIGSISSLNFSHKLIALFSSIIGVGLATVLFPKMSEVAAKGDISTLKRYLMGCIRKLYPLLLPFAAGTMLLATPAVRLVYERGAFTPEDTLRTAECLKMYAPCIISGNISAQQIKALYAAKKTKLPTAFSIFSIGVNITLNFLLVGPLRHRGLALAFSVASWLAMILCFMALRITLGSLGLRSEAKEFAKTVLATAVMSAAVWAGYRQLPIMTGGLLYTVALVAAGVVIYVAMHAVLRTEFWLDSIRQLRILIEKRRNQGT